MDQKRKYIKKVVITDDHASPEARAKRLRMVRNLANLSRKELCESCNINIHTLIGWEVARFGGLPLDGAEKIIKCIAQKGVECSLEWLVYEIGEGPKVITDYATAKIDAQKRKRTPAAKVKNPKSQLINELIFFRKQYNDAVTLLIADDGMSPFYNQGDYVAGIKQYGEKIKSLIGKDCIIQCSNGKIILRNLRAGTEANTYTLACTNPQTTVAEPIMYNTEIASAAEVIRVYRKHS